MSLLAGLIVALGIVGLSRDATHTFHEEMRSSAAEANLRTAIDRLRADLARAGYMSTGNVATDPMVAKAPGTQNPIPPAFAAGLAPPRVHLSEPGRLVTTATPLSAKQPPRHPRHHRDRRQHDDRPTSTSCALIEPSGGSCGCQRIML